MYDHYIALDWAQNIMAIARTRPVEKLGRKLCGSRIVVVDEKGTGILILNLEPGTYDVYIIDEKRNTCTCLDVDAIGWTE